MGLAELSPTLVGVVSLLAAKAGTPTFRNPKATVKIATRKTGVPLLGMDASKMRIRRKQDESLLTGKTSGGTSRF